MRDIKQLHPELQAKIEQLKKLCESKGLPLGIGECLRTVAEQDALYAQGRTKPGKVVTNAKGSSYSSQHQWGIAFDFFKNVKGQEFSDTAFFKTVGALAKSIGLGWGGDWKSPVDMPHCYLDKWGSTTSKLKSQYKTPDKFKATWQPVAGTFYNGLDYAPVFNADFYLKHHADIANHAHYKNNPFEHFVRHGMAEGRQAIDTFNVKAYRQKYNDLQRAFGDELPKYYEHYIRYGKAEKRQGV